MSFRACQWSQRSEKEGEVRTAASFPSALCHYDLPALFFSFSCPAVTNSSSHCLKSSPFSLLSIHLPTTFLDVHLEFKFPIDDERPMSDLPACSAPLGRSLMPSYLNVTGQPVDNCPYIRCPYWSNHLWLRWQNQRMEEGPCFWQEL